MIIEEMMIDTGFRGKSYGWERIKIRDTETGVVYLQLTNAPVNSQVLYFEHQNFTSNNQSILFLSQRFASRNAGWDLFRVDVDPGFGLCFCFECSGDHLVLLTFTTRRSSALLENWLLKKFRQ